LKITDLPFLTTSIVRIEIDLTAPKPAVSEAPKLTAPFTTVIPLPIIGLLKVAAVASYTTGAAAVAFVEFEIEEVTLPHTEASELDAKPSFLKADESTVDDKAAKFAVVFNEASILVAFADKVKFVFTLGSADAFNTTTWPTGATYSTLVKLAKGGGGIGAVKFRAIGFTVYLMTGGTGAVTYITGAWGTIGMTGGTAMNTGAVKFFTGGAIYVGGAR
jgi:hypothetical protein